METLQALEGLKIVQKKEWGEIITGFETKNKYSIMTPQGQEVYIAAEVRGSFLARQWLRNWRPFTIHIMKPDGSHVFRLEAPFRWLFRVITVFDSSGKRLGLVVRRWAFLRRIYTVQDVAGQEIFRLFGPIFHPWTFRIQVQGREVGKIVKRWSGLKELYSDADNFEVSFPKESQAEQKAVLLGAVFLIDFMHFESKQRY